MAAKLDEDEEVIEFDEDEDDDDDDDEDEEAIDEVGDEFKRLLLFVAISVGVEVVGVCWFSGLGFSELFSIELVSGDTDAAPTNDVTAFDMFFCLNSKRNILFFLNFHF